MHSKNNSGKIVAPKNMHPLPERHELHVASILARHFGKDIEFVARSNRPIPDLLMDGMAWEMKSPQGVGRNTIQRQFQEAQHQCKNVIIDAGRTRMHAVKIRRQVEHKFKVVKAVNRLLFISKSGKVFEYRK